MRTGMSNEPSGRFFIADFGWFFGRWLQLSLRSIEYCYTIVSKVFNTAKELGFEVKSPITKAVKKTVKYDNRKKRYFEYEETKLLLENLKSRSQQVHDMALIALYCGARAGEVFGLKWGAINFDEKQLTLRDTKTNVDRHVPMPEPVFEMLSGLKFGKRNQLIFTKAEKMHGKKVKSGKIDKISHSFMRAINELGLNDDVVPKDKATFHTLRHTFASWLTISGESLHRIQKLLGHSSITQTERYAHLCPDFSQAADILTNYGKKKANNEPPKRIFTINGG